MGDRTGLRSSLESGAPRPLAGDGDWGWDSSELMVAWFWFWPWAALQVVHVSIYMRLADVPPCWAKTGVRSTTVELLVGVIKGWFARMMDVLEMTGERGSWIGRQDARIINSS